MLVETARLWRSLGYYSPRKGEQFSIHRATGPDEYNTVVDNNVYTNLMARENLLRGRDVNAVVRRPDLYTAWCIRLDWSRRSDGMKQAADRMYVPYDERLKINPQDDHFQQEPWDFDRHRLTNTRCFFIHP